MAAGKGQGLMCVSMQNGNSDSEISYPVAAIKFRREGRGGAAVAHCGSPQEGRGLLLMTLLYFLLSLITHWGSEVAQWVLTKRVSARVYINFMYIDIKAEHYML